MEGRPTCAESLDAQHANGRASSVNLAGRASVCRRANQQEGRFSRVGPSLPLRRKRKSAATVDSRRRPLFPCPGCVGTRDSPAGFPLARTRLLAGDGVRTILGESTTAVRPCYSKSASMIRTAIVIMVASLSALAQTKWDVVSTEQLTQSGMSGGGALSPDGK